MSMSEFARLGGKLPSELEALVKEFAMPLHRKPIPAVIRQIEHLNPDGGVGARWCEDCRRVLARALFNIPIPYSYNRTNALPPAN